MPALVTLLVICILSCGPRTVSVEEFKTRVITLPNGQQIRVESMVAPIDLQRGMMFRDSLPRGQGMLFVQSKADRTQYWMYQVKIPLDIIWMDGSRRIVEISANTPPCPPELRASQCPLYGGNEVSRFVLEIGGGEAQHFGLKVGDVLSF